MTDLQEKAMRMGLEVLERCPALYKAPEAAQALRTAPPKQPEQRPVGTYEGVMEAMLSLRNGTLEQQQVYGHMKDKLLYTAPPHHVNDVKKREWVGLTDDEIYDYADKFLYQHGSNYGIKSFGKAIEAKLKEKNT